ncbi:hypothetical protein TNCV_1841401 [Trichonephila clavipes]|nr:hypothetical protein TNCV_1841401 [Trichonephila clavipes]
MSSSSVALKTHSAEENDARCRGSNFLPLVWLKYFPSALCGSVASEDLTKMLPASVFDRGNCFEAVSASRFYTTDPRFIPRTGNG